MPYNAPTLGNAIGETNTRIMLGAPLGLVQNYIVTFNQLWPSVFPYELSDPAQRTVHNWLVQSDYVALRTPNSPTINADARQAVADVVIRTLYAAIDAQAQGRITANQANQMLAAWNASFGALP
jgi:hypothetical protein